MAPLARYNTPTPGYTLHWVSSHHSYEAFLAVALASDTGRTATPTNHHSFSSEELRERTRLAVTGKTDV